MFTKDTPNRFSALTISLHWLIAILFIGMMVIGIYMDATEAYHLYDWHKSFGVLLFLFAFIRIVWRYKNGWPTALGNNAKWQSTLAKAVHWILILSTLAFPISGIMMSGAGGHGVSFFGISLIPYNPSPEGEAIAYNATVAQVGYKIHGALKNILIAVIALHVIGALKHHFVNKDGTLRRMLGK